MNRTTLPINEILVEDRQRLDVGDLTSLATSLKTHGLIHPIVVNQARRLIAGGRRLAAAKSLGWTQIDVVFKETLSADHLHELELEENVRRKDMSWQERVLTISKIHALKSLRAAKEGTTWGILETGEMLGTVKSQVHFALKIAKILRSELGADNKPFASARYWQCENLFAAWRLYLRDMEDEAMKLLAQKESVALPTIELGGPPMPVFDEEDLTYEREQYESNPLNTTPFEEYWRERQARLAAPLPNPTIDLSSRLVLGDSIAFMYQNPGRFDHIITDIPYAIDLDNLNQQNQHGGMTDLDSVEKEHDVDYNLKLIADFYPAAFAATKEKSYVITWCDVDLWDYMKNCAIKAGFTVQRWPVIWWKTSQCMNNCANINYTKNFEVAIVCHKPGATLVHDEQSSVFMCGKDELCEKIGHKFAKPFEAWKKLVDPTTLQGQTILEPFAGRGSGVLSMLKMERSVVGVELQQNHYNHLIENVKQYYLKLNPSCHFI